MVVSSTGLDLVSHYERMLQDYQDYYNQKRQLLDKKKALDDMYRELNSRIYAEQAEDNYLSASVALNEQRDQKLKGIQKSLAFAKEAK
jgi:hypothetical protein